MSVVYLIGMPGVGKTYWGRRWGQHFQIPSIDLDEAIEKIAGRSVSEIFETHGESAFRAIEAEILRLETESAGDSLIISCGGGTPVHFNNLERMKTAGCVVWLKADVDFLISQLSQNEDARPLLKDRLSKEKLERILEERRPYYEQAHIHLDVERLDSDTFAQIIEACTSRLSSPD